MFSLTYSSFFLLLFPPSIITTPLLSPLSSISLPLLCFPQELLIDSLLNLLLFLSIDLSSFYLNAFLSLSSFLHILTSYLLPSRTQMNSLCNRFPIYLSSSFFYSLLSFQLFILSFSSFLSFLVTLFFFLVRNKHVNSYSTFRLYSSLSSFYQGQAGVMSHGGRPSHVTSRQLMSVTRKGGERQRREGRGECVPL